MKMYGSYATLRAPQPGAVHFATAFEGARAAWPVAGWDKAEVIEVDAGDVFDIAGRIHGQGFFYSRPVPMEWPRPDTVVKVSGQVVGYHWRESHCLVATEWTEAMPKQKSLIQELLRRLGYEEEFYIPLACGASLRFETWTERGLCGAHYGPPCIAGPAPAAGYIRIDDRTGIGELHPAPGSAVDVYRRILELVAQLLDAGIVPALSGSFKVLGCHIQFVSDPERAPGIRIGDRAGFHTVVTKCDELLYPVAAPLNGGARGASMVRCLFETGMEHGGSGYCSLPPGVFGALGAIAAMEIARRVAEAYINGMTLDDTALAPLVAQYGSACDALRAEVRGRWAWTFGGVPVQAPLGKFAETVAQAREWLARAFDELAAIEQQLAQG